jgi:hypothetical protein
MSSEDRVMMLVCVRWWLWTHLVDTSKCSGWSTQYWTFCCWTLTCRGSTCKGVCPFRGEAHSFSTERKWVGAHQITVNRYLGCWISVQELSNWPVLLLGVLEILWWGKGFMGFFKKQSSEQIQMSCLAQWFYLLTKEILQERMLQRVLWCFLWM